MSGGDALIEARGVTRVLQEAVPVTLVRDVDIIVGKGEFVSVTGPSGSGKSSLLYLLGLLDVPTAGRVFIDGEDTTGFDADRLAAIRLRKIGFVFQFHFLLPEFSVLRNVMLPMQRLNRAGDKEMTERSHQLLEELEIADQAKKRPDQLSGGQRQRVAIARALANDPALILADEPTGNLDSKNSQIVQEIFAKLVRDEGRTVIAVTHEPGFAEATERNIHLVDGRIDQGVTR
ncbi:ABC transporter ATP-binding protein [Parvibaculum sp.]|jgi:lipoprotein-releasing system ATP-binding protein|uniref:ABC transporter ATP-binding protein n=1 Tax=Parvibaculum sp. TaxID=2024848 RepID=UPI000C37291D|nr:ABC transporter ATP-binding protein [Parvibaculum sp.]MAM94118.1 ABC transporter ATP-binding protein [Parvibaculum sp.]HCX68150.1 ABC transporter ATP-binding protein [Rhodobiaceae bacterium]